MTEAATENCVYEFYDSKCISHSFKAIISSENGPLQISGIHESGFVDEDVSELSTQTFANMKELPIALFKKINLKIFNLRRAHLERISDLKLSAMKR